MRKLFIKALLIFSILALGLAGGIALPSQVGAYEWKDSWIDKLNKEIRHLQWKIECLTFELGDDMLVCPIYSEELNLDCDDGTLYMYYYFVVRGYEVEIMYGNIEEENETRSEADHVWLLVESDNVTYAYDWGFYYNDEQHYEGYPISCKKLLYFVMDD